MGSALFEAERAKPTAIAVWTVHISFPAFGDLDAKDFYWATGKNIELEDGQVYTQILTEVPRGRHQKGRGNDYAEFNAGNIDYSVYQEIYPYQDLIEKAYVIVRKAYEVSRDYWESEVQFIGYLKEFTLDDTDKSFKFTVNSDMSRNGFLVGNRIMTRERCGTEFNTSGLADPEFHKCGWQTAQGGNPLFCSKKLKGVDGCEAHNNTHRFFAVTALATAPVTVFSGGGVGGGGWDPPCFADSVFVLMADNSLKPINRVKRTDKHLGFDVFDNDRLIAGEVLNTQKTLVNEIHIADFDLARLEVRKDHLFYIGKQTFLPVAALGDNPAHGLNFEKKSATSNLLSIERSIEQLFVYNLYTSTNNYIVTDRDARFFYFVHNQKILEPEQ